MCDTPLFSVPVQDRPKKRLCFDPSPTQSDSFDEDVKLLLQDEGLPRYLRSVMSTFLDDRKLLIFVLDRNRELTEEVSFLEAGNAELQKALELARSTPQQKSPPSKTVTPPTFCCCEVLSVLVLSL